MHAWQLQKVADEGTSSVFYARLWAGVCELRDAALMANVTPDNLDAARREFDEYYDPVLRSLTSARKAVRGICASIEEHQRKLATVEIVRFQPNAYEISECIDDPLRDHIAQILSHGVRALKGTQKVTSFFGVEIGCLFTKEPSFLKGVDELRSRGAGDLADFLVETRERWSEAFIRKRDQLEHEGWLLPVVGYRLRPDRTVEMREPEVDGLPVSRYGRQMFNCLASFFENVTVHAFRTALKPCMGIREIPKDQQPSSFPRRFDTWHPIMGTPEWSLHYSEDNFL